MFVRLKQVSRCGYDFLQFSPETPSWTYEPTKVFLALHSGINTALETTERYAMYYNRTEFKRGPLSSKKLISLIVVRNGTTQKRVEVVFRWVQFILQENIESELAKLILIFYILILCCREYGILYVKKL